MGIYVVNHFLVSERFTDMQFDLIYFQVIWEIYFFIHLLIFKTELLWLSWCSLCRPVWPGTQEAVCLCLPNVWKKSSFNNWDDAKPEHTICLHISVFILAQFALVTCKLTKQENAQRILFSTFSISIFLFVKYMFQSCY